MPSLGSLGSVELATGVRVVASHAETQFVAHGARCHEVRLAAVTGVPCRFCEWPTSAPFFGDGAILWLFLE